MLLDSLPTELLLIVLHHVGADQFRAHLARLTVNKRWYSIAHEVLLSDVKISCWNQERFPPESIELYKLLKSRVVRFRIHLQDLKLGLQEVDECASKLYRRMFEIMKRIMRISWFLQDCPNLKIFQLLNSDELRGRMKLLFTPFHGRNFDLLPLMYAILKPNLLGGLTELHLETMY